VLMYEGFQRLTRGLVWTGKPEMLRWAPLRAGPQPPVERLAVGGGGRGPQWG
jgi:hypothetical protein